MEDIDMTDYKKYNISDSYLTFQVPDKKYMEIKTWDGSDCISHLKIKMCYFILVDLKFNHFLSLEEGLFASLPPLFLHENTKRADWPRR